jgi:hypothetical protein
MFLLLFRETFLSRKKVSPEEGSAISDIMNNMFTRRPQLSKAQSYKADPARSQWLKFLEMVCEKVFNPSDPRETGNCFAAWNADCV